MKIKLRTGKCDPTTFANFFSNGPSLIIKHLLKKPTSKLVEMINDHSDKVRGKANEALRKNNIIARVDSIHIKMCVTSVEASMSVSGIDYAGSVKSFQSMIAHKLSGLNFSKAKGFIIGIKDLPDDIKSMILNGVSLNTNGCISNVPEKLISAIVSSRSNSEWDTLIPKIINSNKSMISDLINTYIKDRNVAATITDISAA
jgi:hypothetical protein